MKVKALVAFRSKLFRPCRKLLLFLRFKLRKPVFIRALRLRHHRQNTPRKVPSKKRKPRALSFLSVFCSRKQETKMDRIVELMSEAGCEKKLFPSPLTPAYAKAGKGIEREMLGGEEVEDACRSFENYLVEMIVEEGKVRDLMDVEELLYCWKNLKCPVFIDLVCRFYGELCKDLFSPEE